MFQSILETKAVKNVIYELQTTSVISQDMKLTRQLKFLLLLPIFFYFIKSEDLNVPVASSTLPNLQVLCSVLYTSSQNPCIFHQAFALLWCQFQSVSPLIVRMGNPLFYQKILGAQGIAIMY